MPHNDSIGDNEGRAFISRSSTDRGYSPLVCPSQPGLLQSFAKITSIFFLCSCVAYFFRINHRRIAVGSDDYQPIYHIDETDPSPLFIFGHSTGHAGTGTFHESLIQAGCPWNSTVDEFEYLAQGEEKWPYDSDCSLVKMELIPHLYSITLNASISDVGTVAYVDVGKLMVHLLLSFFSQI